jgi:5-methylcytosine-specific restriction endonuclease McrA
MPHTPAQKKAQRAARKAAGLCYFCPSPAVSGQVRCASCAAAETQKRRASGTTGRCSFCPTPRVPGKSRCAACLETARVGAGAKRAKRAELGVCVQCAAPSKPGSTRCATHASVQMSSARASTLRLRARTREEMADDRDRLHPDGMKLCRYRAAHDGPIPVGSFDLSSSRPDGLQEGCKSCRGPAYRRIAMAYWHEQGVPLECVYCGGPFEHVDHVIPASRGGTDDPDNLVPACTPCNTSKGNKLLAEWRA